MYKGWNKQFPDEEPDITIHKIIKIAEKHDSDLKILKAIPPTFGFTSNNMKRYQFEYVANIGLGFMDELLYTVENLNTSFKVKKGDCGTNMLEIAVYFSDTDPNYRKNITLDVVSK